MNFLPSHPEVSSDNFSHTTIVTYIRPFQNRINIMLYLTNDYFYEIWLDIFQVIRKIVLSQVTTLITSHKHGTYM